MNIKYMLAGLFVSTLIGCTCADALEFDGEVVQLTGAQSGDISWNKSNFGGFCYNLSDDACVGTETLTIANGTLEGPDSDRTIDENSLTYTTQPISREYELHRNLGLTVESDHSGGDSSYWIEFWMGVVYVAIDGDADKLAKLLVEWGSTDTKTLAVGEVWDLGGGFALEANYIDLEGEKVWLYLYKNGVELDNEVIDVGRSDLQDRVYTYTADIGGEDDVPVFSGYVDTVFRGRCSNLVQVKYVFLIDDDVTEIDTGCTYDVMDVMAASSFSVTLKNYAAIDLDPDLTMDIMGNISFEVADNEDTIEFYPRLTRDAPHRSGDGGFVLDDYQISSTWTLSEDYSIVAKDVDTGGCKARIALLKNGEVVDESILTEEFRAPVDSDCRYRYVRDGTEIITATLKSAFRGCDSNMIELGEVYQRSEVDGSILINNESHRFPTAIEPDGIQWNLSDDYMLTVPDVSVHDMELLLQLSKNGVVVKEGVLNEDHANTFTYISGVGGVNCVVDRVFRGCEANVIKLANVNQYSDVNGTALIVGGLHFYKWEDPDGMLWELSDGYVLTMKDLSDHNGWYYHVDDRVWLELSKDGVVLKEGIHESDDLFEYRNGLESFDCMVEAVFNGCLADVVKLKNVNQYSGAGTQLVENESKTYASANPTGEVWKRWEGYSLDPKDIALRGDKVWLALSNDGVVAKDEIIRCGDEDRWFKYYNATGALIFSTCVDAVFRDTDTNFVQLRYTTQYSEIDGSLLVNPSNESWQLGDGYNLTAIEVYYNDSVRLQLSKNNRYIDEDLFHNGFSLQNDIVGRTIVSGTISDRTYHDVQLVSITQYSEATGLV